jgi:hydrogenase maturation protease
VAQRRWQYGFQLLRLQSCGKLALARSVVLGIGNVLLTDEGAGVHAARLLAQRLAGRADVQVLDGGTLSFTLAPLIAGADRLIVLDAMQLGEPPGTVQRFLDAEVDEILGRARLSVHEIGLRDMLDIARLGESCPRQRALVGIQPGSLDWGTEPTAAVAAALCAATDITLGLLAAWPTAGEPPTPT